MLYSLLNFSRFENIAQDQAVMSNHLPEQQHIALFFALLIKQRSITPPARGRQRSLL
jgi:hypothetical protein